MPAQDVRRYTPAISGLILPTKQYPHLKQLIHEVDFICSNCTSGEGRPIYRTFAEAHKEHLGGPNQYTTKYTVYCPVCRTTPTDGEYIHNGIIDLLEVPKGYKRPPRPAAGSSSEVVFEEDDQPVVAASDFAEESKITASKGKKAKTPTAAAKAKKARLKAKKQKAKLAALPQA